MDGRPTRLSVAATPSGWSLAGEIDAHSVSALDEAFASSSSGSNGGAITIEVAGVDFIDSSGLRALISLAEVTSAEGGSVVLSEPSPAVARLLRVTGLESLFGLSSEAVADSHSPAPQATRASASGVFVAELNSIPAIRDFVRDRAADLGDDWLADVELVASELATNAVRHGAGNEILVTLTLEVDATSVAVVSKLAEREQTVDPATWRKAPAGLTGRGLNIVERVGDELEFELRDGSVEVTSRVRRPHSA